MIEWCNLVLYALVCTLVIFMRLEFRDALYEYSDFLLCTSHINDTNMKTSYLNDLFIKCTQVISTL
jgi:hypothetical protein